MFIAEEGLMHCLKQVRPHLKILWGGWMAHISTQPTKQSWKEAVDCPKTIPNTKQTTKSEFTLLASIDVNLSLKYMTTKYNFEYVVPLLPPRTTYIVDGLMHRRI